MRQVVKKRLRQRLIVTLKSGESFDGVLWEADQDAWVLRNAQALQVGERNSTVPLDGELVLLTAEIAYAQKP